MSADPEEEKREKERMKKRYAMEKAALKDEGAKKDGIESCSCIEGNPCVVSYGCMDWSNRFAIARKNGWKEPGGKQ